MLRAWFLLPTLLATAPAPELVYVRIAVETTTDGLFDRGRAIAALERGLFSDSLVVQSPKIRGGTSAGSPLFSPIVLVRGSIRARDQALDVCIVMVNTLVRPMSGPDSARVQPEQLDSVLTAIGRRYAEVLSKRAPYVIPKSRCSS